MNLTRFASIAFAASSLVSAPASADPVDETIYIVDDAPTGARDRERLLGEAPMVTVLHADQHAPTSSVADALATTAGTQLTSTGGLGAYQTISVRGASPGHTAVLIDGLPLARIAAVTTDLGRFSMGSFGSVELYRGAVPVELGGAGMGGAVNLVTRLGRGERGERIAASAGMGSFGAMHVRGRYGDEHGDLRSATTIGYQGAEGDFTFFDNNGTTLNPGDDRYLTRQNNRFDRIDAATRLGSEQLVVGVRSTYQRQGLAGSTSAPTMTARLSTLNALADAQLDHDIGHHVAYAMVERQGLHDPDGELALSTADRTYTTLSGGAASTWRLPIVTVGAELRGDRFRDEAALDAYIGTRVGGALSASMDLALAPQLVVTPAVRLDLQRTAPTPRTAGPEAGMEVDPRWDTVPSPRLSARAMLRDDLALKASAGWYTRLPTLIEVFGNRGLIVGSPDLRPETGPSTDVGLVFAPAEATGPVERVLVQASAFANRARNTIAYITTVGFAARAINLENTQAYGGELVLAARFAKLVNVSVSYTRLESAQLSSDMNLRDNPIPRRPEHFAYARAEVAQRLLGREMALWSDVTYESSSTLDQTALLRVPARALLGVGARAELVRSLAIIGTVANLLDQRVQQLPLDPPPSPMFTEAPVALADVTGFPLPGRSFYLSLEWTH